MISSKRARWSNFDNYDRYVGTWSEQVAARFLDWLDADPDRDWFDVGCGTGRLAERIMASTSPRSIRAIDLSEDFVVAARDRLPECAEDIQVGDAMDLPFDDAFSDYTASGLVLNFLPDPLIAVADWMRVTRTGGIVAAYVWDYQDAMEPFQKLWEAAITVDESARSHQLYGAYAICNPEPLQALFERAGLERVATTAITISVEFASIDDYWAWIAGGQGSGPSYVMSLEPDQQMRVKEQLRAIVPSERDGTIALSAKAWAVKGFVPTK